MCKYTHYMPRSPLTLHNVIASFWFQVYPYIIPYLVFAPGPAQSHNRGGANCHVGLTDHGLPPSHHGPAGLKFVGKHTHRIHVWYIC